MEIKLKLLNGSTDMKNKKDKEKCSLKDQLNSTQTDMLLSEPIKMSDLNNPFPNNNFKLKSAESEDIEKYSHQQNEGEIDVYHLL